MAETYIRAEDVSPENARTVLDFLNSAQSAEQIAETIEIPGELDVGLRVAQRILDRRAQLDGGFTTLEQVAAVPYVGPERFTEIVTALTGMLPSASPDDTPFQSRILQELQELRSMVAALTAGNGAASYDVTLRSRTSGGFMGQPILLVAEVKDRLTGRPKANMGLTVTADWGVLQTYLGFDKKEGRAVTAYTNLKGQVELTFLPPTVESMTPGQQDALETALRELDPDAANPMVAVAGFQQIVRRYRADNDKALRSAIDIYFSERQEQLAHAVNPSVAMGAWQYCQTPVKAYLQETPQTGTVQGMAVLNLGLKDWLRPWYATYLALSESESSLQADIDAMSQETEDDAELLDGILNHVYGYIGIQSGRVGESVGQKVAQKAVNHFMSTGFETLPLAAQQTLYPALSIAAKTIRSDTMGSLAVSTRISKDIKANVASQLAPLGDVDILNQKLETVQTQFDQFRIDYTQFRKDFDGRTPIG